MPLAGSCRRSLTRQVGLGWSKSVGLRGERLQMRCSYIYLWSANKDCSGPALEAWMSKRPQCPAPSYTLILKEPKRQNE